MQPTIYARLYRSLSELFPNLPRLTEGSSFCTAPRIPDDWAIYCSVSKVTLPIIELELAHDQVVDGQDQPAPWMVFRIDTQSETAELLVMQDQWRYEVVYCDANRPNPRRTPMNFYAANWLTTLLGLHSVFQPVVTPSHALA
jgi:hypothetical protein